MFDELKSAVTHLREATSRIDVDVIDGKAAAELVRISEEARRAVDSLRTVAVGQVERTDGWKGQGAKNISEWLAIETDSPQHEAQSVVVLATQLQHLPVTRAALRSGALSSAQAVEVARGAIVAPNAETELLNLAKHATVRDLRDASSRVVAAATDEAERHRQVHKSRYLKSWTDLDGSFNLKARMTVANGALVMAALKPIQDEIFKGARKSDEHERPEAYAADALMALCEKANNAAPRRVPRAQTESEQGATGSAAWADLAAVESRRERRSTRPHAVMNIRIDYAALKRGYTEQGELCEIGGVGPIPVAIATEYLGEAFLKLLVIDGTDIKTIAHMGRAIPAKVRTALEERDRVCQVPTCDMTIGLEIDHIVPFAEGGATSLENLVRLCKRHHLQKTHDGYRLIKIEASEGEIGMEREARWGWRAPPDLRNTG